MRNACDTQWGGGMGWAGECGSYNSKTCGMGASPWPKNGNHKSGLAKRKQAPGRKTQRSPDWAKGLVRYERGTRHQGPHGAHTWGLARPSWTGARAGGTRRATTGQRTQETRVRNGARLQPRRKRKSREKRSAEKPTSAARVQRHKNCDLKTQPHPVCASRKRQFRGPARH